MASFVVGAAHIEKRKKMIISKKKEERLLLLALKPSMHNPEKSSFA